MDQSERIAPQARANGLIVKTFNDETLVYDAERDKAHCLNQTAALVWKRCDGKTTIADVARQMQAELQAPVEEQVVWYALAQLDKYHLLQEPVVMPSALAQMSRRQFLQALKVAAIVAVPVIVSVTAPTPAMAQTCLPPGAHCTADIQCCSGTCDVDGHCL